MNPFEFPFDLCGDALQRFQIERNGHIVCEARGFFCDNDYPDTIQLVEDADVRNGDWLIASVPPQRYFVENARPILIGGKPSDWLVKYQTEQAYRRSCANVHQSTFNIQAINGTSVIGSQEHVTINVGFSLDDISELIKRLPFDDQSEAEALLRELKSLESAPRPTLVRGSLSKFSDLLKKHSDLLIAVGGWAVDLLIGH